MSSGIGGRGAKRRGGISGDDCICFFGFHGMLTTANCFSKLKQCLSYPIRFVVDIFQSKFSSNIWQH